MGTHVDVKSDGKVTEVTVHAGNMTRDVKDLMDTIDPGWQDRGPYSLRSARFLGSVELPDQDEPVYVERANIPGRLALGQLDPTAARSGAVDVRVQWAEPDLTLTCNHRLTGEFLGKFTLTRVTLGRRDLAMALPAEGPLDWVPDLLELPDVVAAVTSVVNGDALETTLGYGEVTGQEPLMEFAEELTRAGVQSWTAPEHELLLALARDWSDSAQQLVAVTRTALAT